MHGNDPHGRGGMTAAFWVSRADPAMKRFSPDSLRGATGSNTCRRGQPLRRWWHPQSQPAPWKRPQIQDEHGWRLGLVVDPFGHEWEIGRPLGEIATSVGDSTTERTARQSDQHAPPRKPTAEHRTVVGQAPLLPAPPEVPVGSSRVISLTDAQRDGATQLMRHPAGGLGHLQRHGFDGGIWSRAFQGSWAWAGGAGCGC
jgi:hypothetical protein